MADGKRRNITIKDVAAEAGVSLQTVSRVMNKGPNVTPKMHARVMEAVNKLGYVPSIAARRLGGSRSFLILAFNDRRPTIEGWENRRGNDWVDQMLYGGMLTCAEHGYRMIFELIDSHSDALESEVQGAISSLHPDGIILTPPHSDDPRIRALIEKNGIEYARIGSQTNGGGHRVFMDDRAAAACATEHLIGLGHRRIGFIEGNPEYRVSELRLAGYRDALAAGGIDFDPALICPGDFTYEAGERALGQLVALDPPVTAVLASSDEMALGLMHRASEQGITVPRDLSIVSFDDTPTVRLAMPPLTAINQPIAAMTAKAAALLIAAKKNGAATPGEHVVPFGLEVRKSTAPPSR